jgi:hypothetical protein
VGSAVLMVSAGWVGLGRVPGVLVITGSMVPGTGTGFTMGGLSNPNRDRRKSRGTLLTVVEAITSAMATTARAGRLIFASRERAIRLSNWACRAAARPGERDGWPRAAFTAPPMLDFT